MNKDFGCYCGFLADMIMKYAPEIKEAYNIDTLQQCRCFSITESSSARHRARGGHTS